MPVEHLSAIVSTHEAICFGLEKALTGLVEKQMRDAAKPRFRLLVDASGVPMFHTVRDRLGDIMRVYRAHPVPNRVRSKYDGAELRAIRSRRGVGRPVEPDYELGPPMQAALHEHGSQRAAARALGLNLSTFQRRLAKERAA